MNKKAKVFIVNNQEDEDGYNINPENMFLTENIKNSAARQSQTDPANTRSGIIKTKPGGLYVSASLSQRK